MKNEKIYRQRIYKDSSYFMEFQALYGESKVTEGICDAAIKTNPCAILHIPNKYKTEEMYMKFFKVNWKIIYDMPKEFITEEMRIIAIENDINYILKLYETDITKKIVYITLENMVRNFDWYNRHRYRSFLSYVPDRYKNEELYSKMAITSECFHSEIPKKYIFRYSNVWNGIIKNNKKKTNVCFWIHRVFYIFSINNIHKYYSYYILLFVKN